MTYLFLTLTTPSVLQCPSGGAYSAGIHQPGGRGAPQTAANRARQQGATVRPPSPPLSADAVPVTPLLASSPLSA